MKKLFGRLFFEKQNPSNLFIYAKEKNLRIPINNIAQYIGNNPNCSDEQVVGALRVVSLKPSDILDIRVYLHRFGGDFANPKSIDDHTERYILLDENMPHQFVLPLSAHFAWATHVSTESFNGNRLSGRGTPDIEIYNYAQEKGFAGIVTQDSDFLKIQKEHSRAVDTDVCLPTIIHIKTSSNDNIAGLFNNHGKAVKKCISNNSRICELSDDNGFSLRL